MPIRSSTAVGAGEAAAFRGAVGEGEQRSVRIADADESGRFHGNTVAISEPSLFWLDAHYCQRESARGPHDPPLRWELRSIVARGKRDVVLVDDARLAVVNAGYPSIDEIRSLVEARAPSFEVRRDIIRIVLDAADSSASAVAS